MAKRNVPPTDTALADFRESAGLTPPPRTLSNAETRLVDLLDEFLYSLRCGWEIPPGFPRDRFVPSVSGKRDLVVPIVQYLVDLGFTGDARRLDVATRRFYEHRDWRLMTPSSGDDKGWKEFQKRYVNPLVHLSGCLQAVICDVRQLIIDTDSKSRPPGGQKTLKSITHNEADDPIEAGLSGQQLKIYKLLRAGTSWTSYDTLGERHELWRVEAPADDTIQKALKRLQDELNELDTPIALEIQNSARRTRLDK